TGNRQRPHFCDVSNQDCGARDWSATYCHIATTEYTVSTANTPPSSRCRRSSVSQCSSRAPSAAHVHTHGRLTIQNTLQTVPIASQRGSQSGTNTDIAVTAMSQPFGFTN